MKRKRSQARRLNNIDIDDVELAIDFEEEEDNLTTGFDYYFFKGSCLLHRMYFFDVKIESSLLPADYGAVERRFIL